MSNIKKCVEALPEIYQNIYGHSEFSEGKSRDCKERLVYVEKIIKGYQEFSGKRELRVLDLGCAQGFYSFSLASIGCIVDGIDFNEQNIALCKELQQENGLPCTFRQDVITKEMVDQIDEGAYDVILIFSVIHHIAHEHGFEYARELMTKLAEKSKYVLTELAVKEEPLYWNQNLPPKYSNWFDKVAFFDEQCFFGTHLSDTRRPFIFYSNSLCYAEGIFYPVTEYKQAAYKEKPVDPERRYYLCNDNTVLIKV
nr:methyltransferase domain-containing protein [Butyrivibrio sp.]